MSLPVQSEQTHLSHPKYRADIDGLRAVAVLSVVGFHAFPGWVQGGFIGVDIFFVISGFLISSIIIGSLAKGTFSFSEFYARRIKRIFPALILVTAAGFVFGWFTLFPGEYKQLGKHIASGAGFVSNFFFWQEAGYFDNAAETKPLLHLWSLGIEEQFYIVWPLLLYLVWKHRFNFLIVAVSIVAISFSLNIGIRLSDPVQDFYSPLTRFWELMSGSILAYLALQKINLWDKSIRIVQIALGKTSGQISQAGYFNNAQSFAGALLIGVAVLLVNKDRLFPGWWALLPAVGAYLIISAGQHAWLNRKILSHRLMVWFGLISYPLYLWHWPIISFAHIIEDGMPSLGIRIAVVLISIALAWLTYLLIEKPIRLGSPKNATTIVLSGLLILEGSIGFATYNHDGFDFRLNKHLASSNMLGSFPKESPPNEDCNSLFPQFKEFHECSVSHQGDPSIAIVGDSHSRRYYFSLKTALPEEIIIGIAGHKCLPFSSNTHKCQDKSNITIEFLRKQKSIKTVYLAGYWSFLAAGRFDVKKGNWRIPAQLTPDKALTFQENGEHFISSLMEANKEVVIIRDIPDLTYSINSCLYDLPIRFLHNQCAMDKDAYEKRISNYNSALDEILVRFPKIRIFDPKSIFCDHQLCSGIKENQLLYDDGDHPSSYAADLVIQNMLLSLSNK